MIVAVTVEYPRPVFDTAAQVRRRVATRLAELAGIDKANVRIEITELTLDARPSVRRVV